MTVRDGFALQHELPPDISHVPTKAVGFACLVTQLSQVTNAHPCQLSSACKADSPFALRVKRGT